MNCVVYLALGTNLGERLANLQVALEAMWPEVQILEASPVYETPPWGVLDQPAFLNQAARATTELQPVELLDFLKRLEVQLGRTPGMRYGPRQIDLDILFYDDLVLETARLVIPHPHMAERAFVLVPLADLAANLCHPLTGKTVAEMLAAVDASGVMPYAQNLRTR